MHLADGLARRRIDARVVIEGPIAVSQHRLRDHDPRVGVAKDAGVLLVARWIGSDLAQFDVITGISGLIEHDAVRRRQMLRHRRQRPFRVP